MPQLRWNQYDLVEGLESITTVDEYETQYEFSVRKKGIQLRLIVWPLESAVEISIRSETIELPLLDWFSASVRDIRMLRIEEFNDLMPAIQQAIE